MGIAVFKLHAWHLFSATSKTSRPGPSAVVIPSVNGEIIQHDAAVESHFAATTNYLLSASPVVRSHVHRVPKVSP
jgi:hypothetical protein